MEESDDETSGKPLLLRPECDEFLSRSRLNSHSTREGACESSQFAYDDMPESSADDNQNHQVSWDHNYREAAIYLQEGQDNEKFSSHPRRWVDLPAYVVAHSTWFYVISLLADLLLLALAIFEAPAVPIPGFEVPLPVHAVLEILGLLIIAAEMAMRLKWIGLHAYVRHIRTTTKTLVLLVMIIEAIVVIARGQNHIRITRALRPVFLLDSPYCRGVRRFFRQIIQSMPPIMDMLILLLFFILLFSMLGFYLFYGVPNDTYFRGFIESFISLFILLTTANYPDVMMPAYKHNRWSVIFFIIYISIEIFLFMNLFLAVVYSTFMKMEKEKLKKLLLHRRLACASAFKLLTSGQHPNSVSVSHFEGCMKYFRPRMSRVNIYLSFKLLNVTRTGKLNREEFMAIYDAVSLAWKLRRSDEIWSANFRYPFKNICRYLNRVVKSRWFEYVISGIIILNLVWITADTIRISVIKPEDSTSLDFSWIDAERRYVWCSLVFVAVYVVEAITRILGLGPHVYFSSGWNVFDFIVTLISFCGFLLEILHSNFYPIIVVRPLRILRLFKLKRRYRDVFGTLFILISRMCRDSGLTRLTTQKWYTQTSFCHWAHVAMFIGLNMGVAMLLLYYFFAIIGMEVFASYTDQLKNCCDNTSVEQYYMVDNVTGLDGYYYLNTFENILISGVTLFELTVVNNWWIIMEGYATVVSSWARIYFIVFYLIIMIFMNVVVAFILDAFIFRIQYRQQMKGRDMDDRAYRTADVRLSTDELRMCNHGSPLIGDHIVDQRGCDSSVRQSDNVDEISYRFRWYRGTKRLSKNDYSRKMYSCEVQEWIAEYNATYGSFNTMLEQPISDRPSMLPMQRLQPVIVNAGVATATVQQELESSWTLIP